VRYGRGARGGAEKETQRFEGYKAQDSLVGEGLNPATRELRGVFMVGEEPET